MNGLELSRGYYQEYGKPMLETEFSDFLPYLAIGFLGSGSERFGFDDSISRDHDFEPGFCVFLPGEDIIDRKTAFRLERAYAKLPKEYCGIRRQQLSPVGGNRNGILRTAEFYASAVGEPSGILSAEQWLRLPDYALAEAVNGDVFCDPYGEFTSIRERLMQMPEDIRLKRIAGNLLLMAQSGQYNFLRCMQHGEAEAAQFACSEFVTAAMKVLFLLQHRYLPYYKWAFRALRQLFGVSEIVEQLSFLLSADHRDPVKTEEKYNTIEEVASVVIGALMDANLTSALCGDLEKHAYSVNDKISDSTIRNMHILSAI